MFHLDINSLYPSVMRDYPYPRRLERYAVAPSVTWLRKALRSWCVCAHVWVDTDTPYYPKLRPKLLRGEGRGGKEPDPWPAQAVPGRTYYPVGCYRTHLCGLELEQAIDRGHVLRVESASLYEPADLFSRYVDFFWGERQRARGDPVREQLVKAHLNSLWGKFLQRAPDRVCTGEAAPPDVGNWGHWYRWDDRDGELYECQAIAGIVTEEVKGDGSWDSFPAIAAHVCANARAVMGRIKERCGAGHYFYEDTDCLFADREGFDRLLLAGWIRPRELGYLKLVGEYPSVTIHGPKHYHAADRLVLAGRDQSAFSTGPATWASWRPDRVDALLSAGGGGDPAETLCTGRVPGRYTHGLVDESGTVRPFRIHENFGAAWRSEGPGG